MPSVTISYANGKATIAQDPNPIYLNYGDVLTMTVGTGFPAGSNIDSIQFFSNNNGAKGSSVGTWQRGANRQPTTAFEVTVDGSSITVEDTDEPSFDDPYWYSLTVRDPTGTTYSADPELINKKKT